ncbi:MAG: 16S rRNA (guanine(966)-N(2))-methyltransferase RsmD [Clostridiales bacterium]|jgi:16S rRNA (guanine(966)-N(2))-methyltransferase RsmD|nr:16S rRNA (guanine(966)-N(2))-methyltransferase RsmD [Clostridiales bacterium]
MRVISGKAKGMGLFSPQGNSIRPTSDYVKESLFNLIGHDIYNAEFLDLFAGSGGVGIEALSRGAASATFIDISQKSIHLIRRNLQKTRLFENAVLLKGELPNTLKKLDGQKFDIIFLDPPYFRDFAAKMLDSILKLDILHEDGYIALEAGEFDEIPPHPSLKIFKERVYSSTKLVFMEVL